MDNTNNRHDDDVVARQKLFSKNTEIEIPYELYRQFQEYLDVKFHKNHNEIQINRQKEINDLFMFGLHRLKKDLTESMTSIILHKGKPPKEDVLRKYGKIASEFLKCYSYPNIHSSELYPILNNALGDCDKRVFKDYRDTILHYANVPEDSIKNWNEKNKLGILPVDSIVSKIPKEYIGGFR